MCVAPQHDISRSLSLAEERFNNLSLEERGKFDEETLVNVNNLRKRMMGAPKSERFNNEYIVVRILSVHLRSCHFTPIDYLRKLGSLSRCVGLYFGPCKCWRFFAKSGALCLKVTILVAAEGEFKLPAINGNADLKAALKKLGSIPADSIQVCTILLLLSSSISFALPCLG